MAEKAVKKSAVKSEMKKLKTLVMMQLKDKLDLSFVHSARTLIIKIVLSLVKLVVAVVAFFAIFFVAKLLSVFRPFGYIPDTVVNLVFVLIQFMSIISCTVGLTKTLYMTADNKVLLTLPVAPTEIYISKLILYYIFELKKNVGLTLPLFVAYGISNGAVWYYYPWLLLCFLFISLVPVAIGAIISIPSLFVWQFLRRQKWLQYLLAGVAIGVIIAAVVGAIIAIPDNINIMGQWGYIYQGIDNFLNAFANAVKPYYYLTLMVVGGTLRMRAQLIQGDTFIYFAVMLGGIIVLLAASFFVAKPLFVKMASKQFEYEKKVIPPKKNRVHSKRLSPFIESIVMDYKDSATMLGYVIQLILPAIATLLLNKIYNSMSTNYTGLVMTKAFNFLVMLVMTLAFNNAYSSAYSREAAARNMLKMRPQSPIYTLLGRITPRAVVILLSTIGVTIVYAQFSADTLEILLMTTITFLVSESHLLWCAEMDVMHNYADQYQTVGVEFDSPNDRNSTIIGFILAILFAFLYYFLSDRGVLSSLLKGLTIALVFTAVRVYLFFTRVKLYFVEK